MAEAPVSQRQIAERLKLSTATVSRSLRNDPAINPATRARVIEAATQMGYQLRAPARAGRSARKQEELRTIGVFIGNPAGFRGDPSSAGQEILAGLSDAAAQQNVTLAVHFVPPEESGKILTPAGQPAAMRAGALAGLILLYHFAEDVVEALARRLPCVSIVHRHPELPVDCIDTDQLGEVGRLVGHLARLGHKRIGFVGWGRGASWEKHRLRGYRQGLAEAGLRGEARAVLNAGESPIDVAELGERAVRLVRDGVTALVAAADHVGYDLCRQLRGRGLAIGRDVSITGYDGMTPPADCPPLTTVRVPFQELGFAAVRRMLFRLQEPAALPRDVLLRATFVEGETTGRCP
jgi:LacI family transcriptional regulator